MDNDTEGKDFATGEEGTHATDGAHQDQAAIGQDHIQSAHQRLVFTDPAAFRYLEEDSSTVVLARERRLKGYEMYVVEQWACSRVHPTFVITTYTGLEQHSVVVSILSVPTDEEKWSPRLRVYLKAITKYHARKKETPLGSLMVTNLSGFPSALTVVPVPDGHIRKHREDFIVNENLKRMGCSGRSGLNLTPPNGATVAKFLHLYKTNSQIPITASVIEMVKLCQATLMLFGKLAPEYADGLLCDVTEQAINDWWASVGSDYFNIDPSDGILGPTTVAAMLGMLMGARNRLHACNAPVAKDVFDLVNTKRGIAYFQKSQKLDRSRRLDRQTLDRLHKVTAKTASGEGWMVPRAVKSTVAELSGKGSDLVNGQEKAGIAEIETLDMETFIKLGSGERYKWLWHGKPRKHNESNVFDDMGDDGLIFNDNEQGAYGWSSKKRDSVEDDTSLRHTLSDRVYLHSHGSQNSIDHLDKESGLRRAALKNVTGRVTDAKSGLGRIRDAVGRRGLHGHRHKYSKDDNAIVDGDSVRGDTPRESTDYLRTERSMTDGPDNFSPRSGESRSGEQSAVGSRLASRQGSGVREEERQSFKNTPGGSVYGEGTEKSYSNSMSSFETPAPINDSAEPRSDYMDLVNHANGITSRKQGREVHEHATRDHLTIGDTRAIEKMENFDWAASRLPPLRTTRSLSQLTRKTGRGYWERRWPRTMSFTAMVDVMAASLDSTPFQSDTATRTNADTALLYEKSLAIQARVMDEQLQQLKNLEVAWVEAKVAQIGGYDEQCGKDQSRIDMVYNQKLEENHNLHDASENLLAEERNSLTEGSKDIETLNAKLEYELSALQSKIEDVEDAVKEFERQVGLIEARAGDLEEDEGTQSSWASWCVRRLFMGLL